MDTFQLLFPKNFVEALGWTILHSLWQATLIAIIAGVAMLVLRHKTAQLRYLVANLALASVLVAALLTFGWYYNGEPAQRSWSDAIVETPVFDAPAEELSEPPPAMEELATPQVWNQSTVTDYFNRHLPLIVLLWMLGMGVLVLRMLGSLGYVFYLKNHLNFPAEAYWSDMLDELVQKTGIAKVVGLVESALVRTPMVVGYFKPVIMFPMGMINRLDPKEAEAIFAHELAHILRHDYLVNILQSLLEVLFYYHPAVWWMSSRIRHEREVAADDAAVRLTGNSIAYAKALVLVQDMAFHPLSPSLAFAGSRKKELLLRVQNILRIQSPNNNIAMEKIIGALTILLVLLGLGYAQSMGKLPTMDNLSNLMFFGDGRSGVWEGKIENDQVCMTLSSRAHNLQWVNGSCFPKSDFSALPQQEGEFTLSREAGTITFKGKFEGNEGYGRFTFATNQLFADWLTQQGVEDVNDNLLIHLFFANFGKDYVLFLKEEGFDFIDADDLTNLAVHEVTPAKIKEYQAMTTALNAGKPDIDEMVTFKVHDIDQAFVEQMTKTGFKDLSLDDIVNAKIHEIDPAYVKQCRDMGFENLSFDDVLNFRIHDINPQYLAELKSAGLSMLSADDIVNMSIHEVSAATIVEFKKMGLEDVSNDDIINFNIHEITPEMVAEFKKLGFEDLSTDDLVNFSIHEVNPATVAEFRKLGLGDLSTDDVVNLSIHEVTPTVVDEFRKMGFSDLSVDDLVNLQIHEIDADYLKRIKSAGFSDLSTDDIVNMRIHDVNPDRVMEFRRMGFKDLGADDAVNLEIHEVTPAFIEKMRNKGFKDLDIEEYIDLKIRYGEKIN